MDTIATSSAPNPQVGERINLVRPLLPTFDDLREYIDRILSTGMVTKGQYVRAFEEAIAEHLQVRHAVAVSSCTTGLMLTYQALNLTGEVVVPSFTFMATVSALVWAGLRPVFAEVDPSTTTLGPEEAERAITPRTSAIVAVHNFGNPADIDDLQFVADRHGIPLIFDAAHGFGALYRGVPVGTQGAAHVYSLSPTKLLIAGEGGIVATNDDELAGRLRMGREYGNNGRYDSAFAGMNARMAEFNAALGLGSLQQLEAAAVRRNEVAALYCSHLDDVPGIGFQQVRAGNRCSYKDFSITVEATDFGMDRNTLAARLEGAGIDTRSYYDPPVHLQTAYRRFSSRSLPVTEKLAEQSLSLPIWSDMDDGTAAYVAGVIRSAYRSPAYS